MEKCNLSPSSYDGIIDNSYASRNCDDKNLDETSETAWKILYVLDSLFPKFKNKGSEISSTLQPMLQPLANILQEKKLTDTQEVIQQLSTHVYLRSDGSLSLDLFAASVLSLNSELARNCSPALGASAPPLPQKIRDRLLNGKYVPIQHILFGLSYKVLQTDKDYPLRLTDPVPEGFKNLLKRSDIIRGALVHAQYWGFSFPRLPALMIGLIDQFWMLMFLHNWPLEALFELYNSFFIHFFAKLSACEVIPLTHFPNTILKKVTTKYSLLDY